MQADPVFYDKELEGFFEEKSKNFMVAFLNRNKESCKLTGKKRTSCLSLTLQCFKIRLY